LVFKRGSFLKGRYYSVLYLKNSFEYNRLGIIVKKRYGNAVFRNYEKRIIREFFRLNKNQSFRSYYDFIIILNYRYGSYSEKCNDYLNLINQIRKNEEK